MAMCIGNDSMLYTTQFWKPMKAQFVGKGHSGPRKKHPQPTGPTPEAVKVTITTVYITMFYSSD
jgi:hypothetical protein